MVQCCRCNRTGLCRGCACVKAGRRCINCLPSKRGSCANTSVPPQPPPLTPPVTAQKRCRTDADLTVLASNSPFPSTCCVPSIPMVSNSAVTNAQDTPTAQLGASNSCPPSLEKDSCVSTVSASPSTSILDIPAYHAAADITFSWSDLDLTSFCQSLKEAYAEIVHWKKNLFKVPLGNVGKSFVAMPLLLGLFLSLLP